MADAEGTMGSDPSAGAGVGSVSTSCSCRPPVRARPPVRQRADPRHGIRDALGAAAHPQGWHADRHDLGFDRPENFQFVPLTTEKRVSALQAGDVHLVIADFTITNVPDLLKKKGDAWAEFFASRQVLRF